MFLVPSSVVKILNEEPEADALLAMIDAATTRFITSPMATWETVTALSLITGADTNVISELVQRFYKELNAMQANVTPEMGVAALAFYKRFGKGSDHGAQLNMSECFTLAVAKSYRVMPLFIADNPDDLV